MHFLIVYHSQSGKTRLLAEAVAHGAESMSCDSVVTLLKRTYDAGPADMIWADAMVFATPENFGYMSGAMKDFFDRIFYPCTGLLEGKAYTVVVGAGNDGTGALESIRRIVRGLSLKEIQSPIVVNAPLDKSTIETCQELGKTIAAGLEVGIY